MTAPRILLYVQHLLGTGHLRRAALIARALSEEGMAVRLVSGGMPVPGLDIGAAELVQLPPMRAADDRFAHYLNVDGAPVDDAWRERRRAALASAWEDFAPDVLIVEAFPFGRRKLRFELLPLLEAAAARTPRPLILCSVRDVVHARRPAERIAETQGYIERFFDRVMVHGDPGFITFDESFARAGEIAGKLAYTGYVAPDPAAYRAPGPRRGVVVSAGGGAVGGALIRAAFAARPRTRLAAEPWTVLVGHGEPEASFDALCREAPSGVAVERARPDFPSLLAGARVSISQAGYNTVMDLLCAGVRAVLVPFEGQGETEQPFRAARLAQRAAARVVAESTLSPDTLAGAVDTALDGPPVTAMGVSMDGAGTTARLVHEWIAAGSRRSAS